MNDFCSYKKVDTDLPFPCILYQADCGYQYAVMEGYQKDADGRYLSILNMPDGFCQKCGRKIIASARIPHFSTENVKPDTFQPKPASTQSAEDAKKSLDDFSTWWDDVVKDGPWTTLERMAAFDAWEYQRLKYEAPKPADFQSADMTLIEIEIALDRALHFKVNDMSDDTIGAYEAWRQEKLQDFRQKLESRDAAQRQAGCEEALKEEDESDNWTKRATEFFENGGCPICFGGDEDGHKPGCEWGEDVEKLETLDKRYAALVEAARDVDAQFHAQELADRMEGRPVPRYKAASIYIDIGKLRKALFDLDSHKEETK